MKDLALRAAKALRLPLLALVTIGVGYLAWMGFDGSVAGFEKMRLPAVKQSDLGSRVLVVSPHPDDETLAAGGLVHQTLAAGGRVQVVVVTCGDGFKRIVRAYSSPTSTVPPFLRLGEVRAAEARRATGALGLPASDLIFLGYPDGSLADLWGADWAGRPHVGTNGRDAVPYPFAHSPGAPYLGSSVASDLASVVTSFAPTAVVMPDADDANADHWAVGAFTQYTLDRIGYRGARLTYLVHRGHFPFPWSFLPSAWLEPPRSLIKVGDSWLTYPLSRATEEVKGSAVDAYASQRRAMPPFLSSFVRRNELFARSPSPVAGSMAATTSLDASAMPGVVVEDPAADTVMRTVDGSADIRRVAFVRAPDGVWLGLDLRSSVAAGVTYRISSRLLHSDGSTTRIDIEVLGRKPRALILGRDSVAVRGPLPMHARGGRMWIRIPTSALDAAPLAMIAAETRQGALVLDRTAWRTVLLR
jgi:LmbE family N-acetylglucosaminyl deacetylase